MITLTINKAEMLEKIALVTHYTGAKMDNDATAFRRIATTEADGEKLFQLMTEAMDDMMTVLRSMSPQLNIGDDVITVTIDKMPANYDSQLTAAVLTALKSYVLYYVISQWYLYTDKQEAQVYATMAHEYLSKAHKMLFSRVRPVRKL